MVNNDGNSEINGPNNDINNFENQWPRGMTMWTDQWH